MEEISFFYYLLSILKSSPEIAPIIPLMLLGGIVWRYNHVPSSIQNLEKSTEDNKPKIALIDKLETDIDSLRNEIVPSSAFKSERSRLDEISKELANLRGAFESTKDGLEKAIENLSQLVISFMNKT
tara:strand:- start:1069 stop:1449 length:381 start_codon:yes stop_codon:yes gene_type:complete